MFNVRKIEYKGFTEFRVYDKPIKTGVSPSEGKRGEGSSRSILESLRRTRQSIGDYSLANSWDWFVTLTFDPAKVDSFNYDECAAKVSQWLKDMRKRKAPDLAYLVVPERHKSLRFHFHGLFSGISSLGLIESGKRDLSGRMIYNVGAYRWGWSTATAVTDSTLAAGYLLKYITKDLCVVTFNRRRYWASRNLDKPVVTDLLLNNYELEELKSVLRETASWEKEASFQRDDYLNTVTYYQLTV